MINGVASKLLKRNTIEHLDYHLTEHCNLNCVGCSTFAPIAEKRFADLDSFKSDMTRLYDLVGDTVQQIHLLGGEPLLHPRVEQFAKVCREIFRYARIDITTNGLLIASMPDSFWKTLKDNNIAIKYTQYPIGFDYEKMVEYIKEKGVYVFSAGGKEGVKYFRRIPLNLKGTFNMYNSFIQCPYTDCAQLKDGNLYHCPASAYAFLLNKKLAEQRGGSEQFHISQQDSINIYDVKDKESVFAFLSSAIPFCQYCDLNNINDYVAWKTSERVLQEWVDL